MMAWMNPKYQRMALRGWHAWMAGGFLIAWLTADEDTYAMHFFAGYAVVAALVLRLVVGVLAPAGSPWRLPRPSLAALVNWLRTGRGRGAVFAWLAAAVLVMTALSAVSGALADPMYWLEDLHEGLSEAALWPIFAHIAFMVYMYGGGRRLVDGVKSLVGSRQQRESA